MTYGGVMDHEDMPGGEADREPDPSDSLRTFGAVMQALREHARYSRTEFASLVSFSKHTVESVELGRRMPDLALVERSEEALGNTGALRKASKYVTRGRGDVGLAAWFRQWARLERVAVSLCTYECRLVPGLLQSEGYARAVFDNAIPPLSDGQLEDQVRARLERQKLFRERPNAVFSFIVEEYVFWRQLGGPEVMKDLIGHVLELTAPRNVTLQIMPLNTESHACLDGPVQLLETPRRQRLAYSEGQQNGRLISDPKEVSLLCQRYDTLRSQALNPKDSRALLERLRGER
ncbi:helix-turn-helix domain-containing protein [Streptomyces sp. Babs14]|uniref:helix-turn-helix domain-containing protein n=1 Tax=unclassified Streptomyces TaxID=2593676 RepID=UPI001C2417A1|nr:MULTISPECIES: helix-turn-helix transcriptional regulator [unclassified Streptomyces]MBU8549434.1 helix-turn-helix domain-containing protein [Streptomyces sp. Osf17]MBU8556212.1 helix-turn-helix domain-containing protein [Streptomyces sp. Babs14]